MPARRKRIEQKVDHRERDRAGGSLAVARAPGAQVVKVPRVSPKWEPLAKDWFRSLKESGQAQFFQPSDWQAARLVAEQMSMLVADSKESGYPIKASAFEALWASMGDLLTTEGSRRKVHVELQRAQVDDPDAAEVVSMIDDYREMFEESG